ncbi:MAG: hypothetical protein RI575_15210, partial [Balneolaceae bacterium]|nr:hypothetical protein [Balneolaceae bacterium]
MKTLNLDAKSPLLLFCKEGILGVVESPSFEGRSEPACAEASEDMLSEQGNVHPSRLKPYSP